MSGSCCSQCGSNGHKCSTCGGGGGGGSGGSGSGEIILLGVRVTVVDPMRKSVSMNNLSEYEPHPYPYPYHLNNSSTNDLNGSASDDVAVAGDYASADDAVPHHHSTVAAGARERKRGVPWSEEEHKLFLLGLQKVGKGDWRGISRNFVKSRTPTQVASHAQKYYLRKNNLLSRRRRRSSLFDITTPDSVTSMPMAEGMSHQDNTAQRALPPTSAQTALSPTSLPPLESFNRNGFAVAPFPATVGSILVPVQVQNSLPNMTVCQGDNLHNTSALLVQPVPVPLSPVLNLSQRVAAEPSPMSWSLSLSSNQNQSSTGHSTFQVMPSFNNGDSIITVA